MERKKSMQVCKLCKKIVSVLMTLMMVVGMFSVNTLSPKADGIGIPTIQYQTHVQTYGWENKWTGNGGISGTYGQAKRLEAIRIQIPDAAKYGLGVEYKTHIQTYGWEKNWKKNGDVSGTSGQAKRLEAIQIRLTGANADAYDIFYRVHAQTYGWLGWSKNGEPAGTAGQSKRLEAIQIVILPKGLYPIGFVEDATGFFSSEFLTQEDSSMGCGFIDLGKNPSMSANGAVSYRTHVQSYGDQPWVSDGSISGTSGEAKRLEQICIKVNNEKLDNIPGGIKYQTHVQSYGWMDWVEDGKPSGTSGKAKRLEAIRIELTGELEAYYDVYYRVHAQTYGWLGWAKNGETAGTSGLGKRSEAIQIVIVPKYTGAPNILPASKGTSAYKGPQDNSVLYVYTWNTEVVDRMEYFYDKYPQYRDQVQCINLDMGGTSNEYKEAIEMSLEGERPASIVAADMDIVDYFKSSDAFVPVENVGIKSTDYANAYNYTKQQGSYNGKLKFLTWQSNPGCFVYRTDIAEKVWGTSDRAVIQEKVKDWDSFLKTAEELKAKGYYILSSPDDVLMARGYNKDETNDSVIKALKDNGYTRNSSQWDETWNADMIGSEVFGYFGCPWFVNWTIYDDDATKGMRNICEGPDAYAWGGTYLGVTNKCSNKELAALVLKTLCCDEDVMYKMSLETLDYVNNSNVNEKIVKNGLGANQILGGANPYPVYNENAKKVIVK